MNKLTASYAASTSLLRWYRVATGQATIMELTRAQASPFRFTVEGTDVAWGRSAVGV